MVGTQTGEPEIRAEPYRTKPEKNRVDQKVKNRTGPVWTGSGSGSMSSKTEPGRTEPVKLKIYIISIYIYI